MQTRSDYGRARCSADRIPGLARNSASATILAVAPEIDLYRHGTRGARRSATISAAVANAEGTELVLLGLLAIRKGSVLTEAQKSRAQPVFSPLSGPRSACHRQGGVRGN